MRMYGSDLGTYQLGDYVPLTLLSEDGDGVPAFPTSTPTFKTYDTGDLTTVVETLRPGARQRQTETGLFTHMLRLTSSYSAGTYLVTHSWAIGGSTHGDIQSFRIVAGGDSDGAVIGQTVIRRPEASVVAYIVDGGKLKTARNPQ